MFFCEIVAGVMLCTPVALSPEVVTPVNFDLAAQPGSYQRPVLLPAVLYYYTPPPMAPSWSLTSTETQWDDVFVLRTRFSPGFTLHPSRITWRLTFNEAGAYVS